MYKRQGVYSGSAFVDGDKIHYFYTGNVKLQDKDYDYILEGREQKMCIRDRFRRAFANYICMIRRCFLFGKKW